MNSDLSCERAAQRYGPVHQLILAAPDGLTLLLQMFFGFFFFYVFISMPVDLDQ